MNNYSRVIVLVLLLITVYFVIFRREDPLLPILNIILIFSIVCFNYKSYQKK